MSFEYDDIINLPHHVSTTRNRMSMHDRAAQFAPFAALTGHSDAVAETARLTENFVELDESTLSILNGKLEMIKDAIANGKSLESSITYFVADEKKDGGKYITVFGEVRKIDEYHKTLTLDDETIIQIEQIIEIEIDN